MKVTSTAGAWTGVYLEMITRKDTTDHMVVAKIRDRSKEITYTIEMDEKDYETLPAWFRRAAQTKP